MEAFLEMLNSFSSLCDDFYVDMQINTHLDLPGERDTVLTFFERIQKQFSGMNNFYRKSNGDFCLEQEKEGEKYRWVNLEIDRICAGCANPRDMDHSYKLNQLVLDIAPYMLGVSHLDIDSLDVTFSMDFDFQGNHNEVIAEALFASTAFGAFMDIPDSKPLRFSPTIILALDEECSTQARVTIESRTGLAEVKNQKFKPDDPISLYFTIRRQGKGREFYSPESLQHQCQLAENMMAEKIVPCFVGPLTNAIAQRR